MLLSFRMSIQECGILLYKAPLLFLRLCFGYLMNISGVPGLLKPSQYTGGIHKTHISVQVTPLFTIVTVNGLDIYFTRLTGTIDGIGFSTDCKSDAVLRSTAPRAAIAAE